MNVGLRDVNGMVMDTASTETSKAKPTKFGAHVYRFSVRATIPVLDSPILPLCAFLYCGGIIGH